MDVRLAVQSSGLKNYVSSFALATIVPIVVLGSGYVIFHERLGIGGQDAVVLTLHLKSRTSNAVQPSGGYRGQQSVSIPMAPVRCSSTIPQPARPRVSVVEPEVIVPPPDSLSCVVVKTHASSTQPVAPPVSLSSFNNRIPFELEDGVDEPLALGSQQSRSAVPQSVRGKSKWNREIMRRFGKRTALTLPGRPYFPRSCQMGLCKSGVPCEGTGDWKLTSSVAGRPPDSARMLSSAGCALLDASIRKYFLKTPIPKVGTFNISINFKLNK